MTIFTVKVKDEVTRDTNCLVSYIGLTALCQKNVYTESGMYLEINIIKALLQVAHQFHIGTRSRVQDYIYMLEVPA